MNLLLKRKFTAGFALFAAAGFFATSSGYAQTTAPAEESPVKLEKYEVTGSYIPYSAEAPSVPVTRVAAEELMRTGETDLLEAIRRAVPQFIGNGNMGSQNSSIAGSSTNGGSRLSLRNETTLVLIDGRRAAFSPVSATGGFDFVDVNSIPTSAVESIEVLKDGASALYGSDAVSGVVNIILKKNYEGAEVGGRYRFADTKTGTWEERSAYATVGSSNGKTSLTASFEWTSTDPLFQNEEDFSFNQTGKTSAYPGVLGTFRFLGSAGNFTYLLADGKTPPMQSGKSFDELVAAGIYRKQQPGESFNSQFNISKYVTLALGNDRKAVTLAVSHKLSDKIELFGDLLYSETDTFLQLAAQPIFGMPVTAQHVTDIGVGATDPDHPQNPSGLEYAYVRNRFVGHPRKYFNDTSTLRGLFGVRGDINENYHYEMAGNLNRVVQYYRNENVINRLNLVSAIDSGVINMFARDQAPGAFELGRVFGTAYSKNISTLNSFDARVVGQIPNVLPSGPIGFAVGAETRRETLSAEPDPGSYTINDLNDPLNGSPALWDGATTTDPFSVHRSVDSFFAEVRVPITGSSQTISGLKVLELDAAVRKDKYSDADAPVVPKITLRWQPFNDEFVVRAAYSESFTAPSLFSLFGPSGVGFSEDLSSLVFKNGLDASDIDQSAARSLTSAPAVAQGFADQLLQPETAKNYNFGVIWAPRMLRGFSAEVTYFRIEHKGIAGFQSDTTILQSVEDLGPASPYANRVRIGSFNGSPVTAPGQIGDIWAQFGSMSPVFITNFAENLTNAFQDGIDVSLKYNRNIEPIGRFDFLFTGMWFNEASVDGTDYVGTTNGRSALNGGTIPRWLGTIHVDYTRSNWIGGVAVNYIPSVIDDSASPTQTDPTRDQHVESFTRVDAYVGYQFAARSGPLSVFKGLRVRVGSTNLFDKQPPSAAISWSDHNADTGTYGALGRVFYIDASLKF